MFTRALDVARPAPPRSARRSLVRHAGPGAAPWATCTCTSATWTPRARVLCRSARPRGHGRHARGARCSSPPAAITTISASTPGAGRGVAPAPAGTAGLREWTLVLDAGAARRAARALARRRRAVRGHARGPARARPVGHPAAGRGRGLMLLRHLALAVQDEQRSREFYERWFGFGDEPAQRYARRRADALRPGRRVARARAGRGAAGAAERSCTSASTSTEPGTRAATCATRSRPPASRSSSSGTSPTTSASRSATPTATSIETSWEA